jgi:Transposase DDE domain group 1
VGGRAVPAHQTRATVFDIDATLVDAHSVKNGAGPTYKGGYGYSAMACFCDATNEALVVLLRPGNAAPHNAADHVAVLELALAQLPVVPKGIDPIDGVAMLVRTDSAGASHTFVDASVERGIEFSIGMEMRKPLRLAVLALSPSAWTEAITTDGEIREGGSLALPTFFHS